MIALSPTLRVIVLALAPLLVSATDPPGDVSGCRGGAGSGALDLVAAQGEIVELGTSARWRITFAEPLNVPDDEGRPFRVDVVIRDPELPALSFTYYRNVNRLVRVDATIDHKTEIYLVPERGANVFNPPIIDGDSMTIQVPGRTLSDDEDLTGTSPGLESLRWTVIVRDELGCDFLGDGRPRERLTLQREAQVPRVLPPSAAFPWWTVGVAAALVALSGFAMNRLRARGSGR